MFPILKAICAGNNCFLMLFTVLNVIEDELFLRSDSDLILLYFQEIGSSTYFRAVSISRKHFDYYQFNSFW